MRSPLTEAIQLRSSKLRSPIRRDFCHLARRRQRPQHRCRTAVGRLERMATTDQVLQPRHATRSHFDHGRGRVPADVQSCRCGLRGHDFNGRRYCTIEVRPELDNRPIVIGLQHQHSEIINFDGTALFDPYISPNAS